MEERLRYLVASIGLAAGTLLPAYFLRRDHSPAYVADAAWESIGVFITCVLASFKYGRHHLGSCIIAAIMLGPFVGAGLMLLVGCLR